MTCGKCHKNELPLPYVSTDLVVDVTFVKHDVNIAALLDYAVYNQVVI